MKLQVIESLGRLRACGTVEGCGRAGGTGVWSTETVTRFRAALMMVAVRAQTAELLAGLATAATPAVADASMWRGNGF